MIARVLPWGFVVLAVLAVQQTAIADRRIELFDADWRFAKGAHPDASQPDYDDANWQHVELPHDWAIAGPFEPDTDGNTGKLPWRGEGWYRKRFRLPSAENVGQRIYFLFDGVMAAPKVYVNGRLAGEWDYGYNSFWIDATNHVKLGQDNVIAVCADTRQHTSRWYPGGGIYRKVSLVTCSAIHLTHWDTQITSSPSDHENGLVTVRSKVLNHLATPHQLTIRVSLLAPDGRSEVSEDYQVRRTVPAKGAIDIEHKFEIPNVRLWDIDSPNLYTANVSVVEGDVVLDHVGEPFGVRKAEFTARDGFYLNGRRIQLKGVNLHHDQGPLGAACYPRAIERQLQIMKEMGVNAIRTSHNPPAPELLELCDRMGLLVFDELFDGWDASADLYDQSKFEPFMRRNAENFVARDRNHPCVIAWSIGNEIEDVQHLKPHRENERKVAFMVDLFKRFDPTRPITMVCHRPGVLDTEILDPLDVQSWNYTRKYANASQRYPNTPVICSESAAAVSTRGFYSLPLPAKREEYLDAAERQISSYDLNSEWWSDIPDVEFARLEEDRFCAGEFVWAGFDYLGEPLPFDDDWARKCDAGRTTLATRSSYFGIVDLCGIPKDRYYLYRSHWAPDKLTIHILPHWNWPDRVGQRVPVFVYTNGDEAELFLNGRSLGRRQKNGQTRLPDRDEDYYRIVDRYRLRWEDVRYEPGELKVVAYRNGAEIGVGTQRTAGAPATLRLTVDRSIIAADGRDLCYVLVEMTDANGTVCPLANEKVAFAVDGPVCIAGVGNGNPASLESFAGWEISLSYGRAMLVVRSRRGVTGPVAVTARAGGVRPAVAKLVVE